MTIEESIDKQVTKMTRLRETILELIPQTGQYPYILLAQARERLPYSVSWRDMQTTFDSLYNEGKIFERQDFTKTILKRAYKTE